MFVQSYYNDVAGAAIDAQSLPFPDGSILVKENYPSSDAPEAMAITVMSKDAGAWYWTQTTPDGQVFVMSGNALKGKDVPMCVGCHEAAEDNDFFMTRSLLSASTSRPAGLWATSLALLSLALVAGVGGGPAQPAFAGCCALAALGPLRPTSTAIERALLLAYGLGAWALFGLAPVVTIAEPLGGPYGAHPLVFVAGVAAAAARIFVLSSPSVRTWATPRV